MKVECTQCGNIVVINGLGRKPLNLPVNNVYDTLRHSSTVKQAASTLNCSRGYIYKILKQHGKLPKDFIKGVKSPQ